MSRTDPPAVHAGLGRVIAQYNAGLRDEAERLCGELLGADPDQPALLQMMAVLCRERGDAARARQCILRSLALRPGHVPSLMAAALVHQDLDELAEACAALDQVLAVRPEHVSAAVNRGVVLLALGRRDDALRSFARAYRREPATFGRIAHALSADRCGALWLDPSALRRVLSDCA